MSSQSEVKKAPEPDTTPVSTSQIPSPKVSTTDVSSGKRPADSPSPKGKGREGKKSRGGWRDRRHGSRPDGSSTRTSTWEPAKERDATSATDDPRLPKRKVALLMGYCGTGYQGMQVNPGAKTIEGDLFNALVRVGAVSEDNADDPKKVGFMRAARTDKGVHAAGQVVSLKMITDLPDLIPSINSHLPDQIRIWGYVRTIKSFHSKNQCDSRVYEYLFPTYILQPVDPQAPKYDLSLPPAEREIQYSSAEEMARKRAYRISPSTLAQVREALRMYVGTWSYHNFTLGKAHGDMSANRYIMSFTCSEPKILDGNTEWLSLKVHGQSFMIHQIRKMVGLIIALIRSNSPLSIIPKAFGKVNLNIPKAPGLGLLLEQTVFQKYNTRVSGGMGGVTRDAVDFAPFEKEMDAFKEKFIYDKIVLEELEHNR